MVAGVDADAVRLEEELGVELHLLAEVVDYLLLVLGHLPEELAELNVEHADVAEVRLEASPQQLPGGLFRCHEYLGRVVLSLDAFIVPLVPYVLLAGPAFLLPAEHAHLLLLLRGLQLVIVAVVGQDRMVLLGVGLDLVHVYCFPGRRGRFAVAAVAVLLGKAVELKRNVLLLLQFSHEQKGFFCLLELANGFLLLSVEPRLHLFASDVVRLG